MRERLFWLHRYWFEISFVETNIFQVLRLLDSSLKFPHREQKYQTLSLINNRSTFSHLFRACPKLGLELPLISDRQELFFGHDRQGRQLRHPCHCLNAAML